MPEELCPICEGAGMRVVERADGTRAAVPCECRKKGRSMRRLQAAQIPTRYRECTLDNFEPDFAGSNKSLNFALMNARNFVLKYHSETRGKGLLFTGPNGTGKTHLAAGIAHALTANGVSCLFVTYGELLARVKNSYNPAVQETELQVLQPLFESELLIIDELGSSKPSDWVWDTVAHILNSRYNNELSTVITTNFANQRELLDTDIPEGSQDQRNSWLSMYKDTLGDRIGERMRSRLQEMCIVLEVTGPDLRGKVKRHGLEKLKIESKKPKVLTQEEPIAISPKPNEPDPVGGARMGSNARRLDVSGRD